MTGERRRMTKGRREAAGGKILRCAQNDNGGEAQNDNGERRRMTTGRGAE